MSGADGAEIQRLLARWQQQWGKRTVTLENKSCPTFVDYEHFSSSDLNNLEISIFENTSDILIFGSFLISIKPVYMFFWQRQKKIT